MSKLYEGAVLTHARALSTGDEVRNWLNQRIAWRDDRGDITPRMVGIALMAAAAIAVLGIVTTKLTAKANNLQLD